jgi:hypothetical protein
VGNHLVQVLLRREPGGYVCERTLVERERSRASGREARAGLRGAANLEGRTGGRHEDLREVATTTQALPLEDIATFEQFAHADPTWELAKEKWTAMSERLFEELHHGVRLTSDP